ncbi:bifunctional aspartate transaminase/aspartate 4-decarboxylase [Actinosynnema sp. CA-299493]
MTEPGHTRAELRRYAQLSPFELKERFIALAEQRLAEQPVQKQRANDLMLNAGRGNPNWTAAAPREAFYALGAFAMAESRRVWTAGDLAGMPAKGGIAARFTDYALANPGLPGMAELRRAVDLGVEEFGFDPDTWVHELADGITADNYPVPDRMLRCGEQVVARYLREELFDGHAPEGQTLNLFATEGGTAAMCYIFDSLMANGLLKRGDRVALMVPIFTPYIEIPVLDTYGLELVLVQADKFSDTGVREWRYPSREIAKLADPSVRLVCLVNPSNPPSLALSDVVRKEIQQVVATRNPNLMIVTDDVYGTFVEGFRSLAADLPRNTLLVYSYSKHYGATGWRLGVIGLHDDNIYDEQIANLPDAERDRLRTRYGTLTLEPDEIRFIDRIVADSRRVALNHTAGLSTPQQVQMTLFSLYALQKAGQEYKHQVREIVDRRLNLLLEGSQMRITDDPHRAAYYIELDLLAEAERLHGSAFAEYLQATYEPVDPLFRLAEQTSVVLLNGGGFDGPEWSVRVSLANLEDLDYLRIGHYLNLIFRQYLNEWQESTAR